MWVSAVRVHRHDHWLLFHSFFAVATEHELRDVPLSGWFVSANPALNLDKRLLNDAMHFVGRFHMHLVLSRGEHGFEFLYQFRACDCYKNSKPCSPRLSTRCMWKRPTKCIASFRRRLPRLRAGFALTNQPLSGTSRSSCSVATAKKEWNRSQ